MSAAELITKVQTLVYALRRGQIEKLLAALAVVLFASAHLGGQWTGVLQVTYVAYALSIVSAFWLFVRLWKQAAPPPPPPSGPMPNAIKGLLPFTVADGLLFARLGRRMELQSLAGLAQDDQIGITVVRGESGAGKTSLLQAGLAYTLGQERCLYWEALPTRVAEALLYTIRSRFPDVGSLESLPESCPSRCVLILDQFEQLRASELEHAPVFALLERIAKGPAPHKLSAVVGFRREFVADWLDFEQAHLFRAEQIPVNLLAQRTASDALVTLATESGFTLDNALVEKFVAGLTRPEGVSPVDLAVGVLSLANFVQQSGNPHVGMAEYELAGGAEGLLLSFVQQKLEEVPEPIRAPLLKGVLLALVDLSNDRRVAEGATAAVIASKTETPETSLAPWLERLAHPRIRLLEKTGSNRYRLPHERLIPVLRRLTGTALASVDQMRLMFESEYARWRKSRSRRDLLHGGELREVLRNKGQLVQGEAAALKTEYLNACLRRRTVFRLAASATVTVVMATAFGIGRIWDSSMQRQKLASWNLPPGLYKTQGQINYLDIKNHHINDLSWLRSSRLRELHVSFDGPSLKGLDGARGLTSLTLDLSDSNTSLAGLEQLTGLTSLTLDLGNYEKVPSLASLEQLTGLTSLDLRGRLNLAGEQLKLTGLKGLTSLTLYLRNSGIPWLAGLEQFAGLKGLTSLTLNLRDSSIQSLLGLEQLTGLKGLTSLTLNLQGSRVHSLAGLERLTGLTSLTLDLRFTPITSLAGLEQLTGLTSLTLDLRGSEITSLAELEKLQGLKGLASLTLDLRLSKIPSLAELEKLKGLTSLTLDLHGLKIPSLAELEKLQGLKGLTSLTLDLRDSLIQSLAGLEQLTGLKGLTSLTLDLLGGVGASEITSLAGLERLTGLTSLTLNLGFSKITSLAELGQLRALKSTKVTIFAPMLSNFSHSGIRCDITTLLIYMERTDPLDVPTGCKFVGLIF